MDNVGKITNQVPATLIFQRKVPWLVLSFEQKPEQAERDPRLSNCGMPSICRSHFRRKPISARSCRWPCSSDRWSPLQRCPDSVCTIPAHRARRWH